MRVEVRKLVKENEELQLEIKKKLATQLINININVKNNLMLKGEYDENIDLDLLYEMYQKATFNLTFRELLKIFTPYKHKFAREITNQENTFDIVMNKLKTIDFENSYKNTYRDYIVDKYYKDKAMFIPKKYLESDDKLNALSSMQVGYDATDIAITFGYREINAKADPEYVYYGQKGIYRTEYDACEELIFSAVDEVFGGTEEIIVIPYMHYDIRKEDEGKELINIGFLTDEKKHSNNFMKNINEYIHRVESFIRSYINEISSFNYRTSNELKFLKDSLNTCYETLEDLKNRKQAMLEIYSQCDVTQKRYK